MALKPLWRMLEILFRTEVSDICVTSPKEWASRQISGTTYSVMKHHPWVVLSRGDAARFAENCRKLSTYRDFAADGLSLGDYKWSAAFMGGDGLANASAALPRQAFEELGVHCPDEEVFTTMLFGLHEPSSGPWQ